MFGSKSNETDEQYDRLDERTNNQNNKAYIKTGDGRYEQLDINDDIPTLKIPLWLLSVDGIALLLHFMRNPNNYLFLMGNHEELMLGAIKEADSGSINRFYQDNWFANGGNPTCEAFCSCSMARKWNFSLSSYPVSCWGTRLAESVAYSAAAATVRLKERNTFSAR